MNFDDDQLTASGYIGSETVETTDSFTQIELLGTHGHNVLARAKRYGRLYLLKAVAPDKGRQTVYHTMLAKEFNIMMRLQHPGIVQAVSYEDVPSLGRSIVMEWIEGVTLKEWLEGDTTPEQRRRVASQLIDALEFIHLNDIAHRDIKPSNIMVTRNGNNVKIIDFGLADTDAHAILKQPGGTEQYMSPEQSSQTVPDIRNDIYSLGLVLRQMDLGREMKPVIARCLLPIDERYHNIAELKKHLLKQRQRRRAMFITGAAIALAALVAAAIFITLRYSKGETKTLYVEDNRAREQVDSLRNELNATSSQMQQSRVQQDSLQQRMGGLNDSLSRVNAVNSQLQQAQNERDARQKLVENAIAKGVAIVDEANAATRLQHHIDTLSRPQYLWMDWHYQATRGEAKINDYINTIRSGFTTKELSEIEYAVKEHSNNYVRNTISTLRAKNCFLVTREMVP